MTDLNDKVTLITGAARGMGRRMAERFGERGARLVLVDVDGEALTDVRKALEERGFEVDDFVCDLSRRENIDDLRDRVHDEVGRVEVLVNNAGVVRGGRLEDVDDAGDELTFRVNIEAVHWMTKRFLRDLKQAPEAHLVQMASAAGLIGVPEQVTYSASKWFVIGFSRALRQELIGEGHDHIGMTIVCPSLVDTGMFEGAKPPRFLPLLQPEEMVEKIVDAVRSNRLFVREPFLVKTIPFMKGILPAAAVDFVLDRLGVRELMKTWTGRHADDAD